MSPPSITSLFSVLFFVALSTSSAAADGNKTLTAYQLVEQYGFPAGILPVGVTGYELDESSGNFKVYFPNTCSFKVDDYELRYKSTISGKISKGKIKDLKGVSVKVLLFWVNISEVSRDGNEIDFSVGIASASFDATNFVDSPRCGCGFDCVDGGRDKVEVRLNRFVSDLALTE